MYRWEIITHPTHFSYLQAAHCLRTAAVTSHALSACTQLSRPHQQWINNKTIALLYKC